MESYQEEPNAKRRRKNDKRIGRTGATSENVNDFCLIEIFGHLDLQSLYNVAIANEWQRVATRTNVNLV